jgi:hypothetical protein
MMAAIQLTLATRLVAESKDRGQDDSDSLLTVEQAAANLNCSEDWLYRLLNAFRLRFGWAGVFASAPVALMLTSALESRCFNQSSTTSC